MQAVNMEPEIRGLAERTLEKLNELTEEELQGFSLSRRRNNSTRYNTFTGS